MSYIVMVRLSCDH